MLRVAALLYYCAWCAAAADIELAGEDAARASVCTDGAAVLRGVEAVSLGMNGTAMQIRTAFKDLVKQLRVPFVYAIASTVDDHKERSLQLSLMLGGVTLVFKSPSRQGIHFASCFHTAKDTQAALLDAAVHFRIRRDLRWSLALWEDMAKAPYMTVCRDPDCRPFGMNEFLPERRVFGDGKEPVTKRQFQEAQTGSKKMEWTEGTVVPYADEEEIKRSPGAPKENRAASNKGALGGLRPAEVVVDYDPQAMSLEHFETLAVPGSVLPAAGALQKEGHVNCEKGCRFKYARGPDLVFQAKDVDAGAKRKASVRAVVWETNKFASLKQTLENLDLLGAPLLGKHKQCCRLSLLKYGIASHTGLWFCPKRKNA